MILAARRRMVHSWRDRNAAQIPQKTSCGARRLKTIRQPLSGEVVNPSLFSKTISWPTYRGPPQGEVSPHLTKTNRQPLLGRVVRSSFLLSRTNWQTYQRVRWREESVVLNRVKSWLQDRALRLVDKIRQSFQQFLPYIRYCGHNIPCE
jgi:hypothetical protein